MLCAILIIAGIVAMYIILNNRKHLQSDSILAQLKLGMDDACKFIPFHFDNGGGIELKSGNSADYRRADFTREEIIDLYYRYEHEFNYIVSYLERVGDLSYRVEIRENLEQVYFGIFSITDMDYDWKTYTKHGYQKDEEFERCLRTVLVEGELGYIQQSIGKIYFGPNLPLRYSKDDLLEDESEDSLFFGRIEDNWYYYVQDFV